MPVIRNPRDRQTVTPSMPLPAGAGDGDGGQAAGESPGFIAPMLATAAAGLPLDAAEFVAEVK
jgi:hypothetical protein